MKCQTRPIKLSERYLLEEFLYNAVFQKNQHDSIPRAITKEPSVNIYIKDYGKPTDSCLVAEVNKKIVGCVWTRILDGLIKGYGYLDSETPEFAISVYKEYRGFGIGTRLMKAMLELLKSQGYTKTSLSVQKENFAVKMYENLGFRIIKETEEDYIMICKL